MLQPVEVAAFWGLVEQKLHPVKFAYFWQLGEILRPVEISDFWELVVTFCSQWRLLIFGDL